MAQQITGRVAGIVFRNDENGYTVLEIETEQEIVTAVGMMPTLTPGSLVHLSGEWTQHKDFGPQFKVNESQTMAPTSVEDIIRYLGSGLISGVGMVTARRIVDALGEDTLDILRYDPERVCRIKGIGRRKGMSIIEAYGKAVVMQDLILFLQGHGMTVGMAVKVFKRYGEAALARIQENPYRLAADVEGIGFITADRIAMSMGVENDSPFRVTAGALSALSEALGEGNLFLPREEAVKRASDLLKLPTDRVEEGYASLMLTGGIICRDDGTRSCYYLPSAFRAEGEVARRLADRGRGLMPVTSSMLEAITDFEVHESLELDDIQRIAVEQALERGTLVITGGPGTGKTTILRCILYALERARLTVLLAAPTGRAAKRMAEATGEPAATLHRLLEYGGGDTTFQRDEDNPLDGDALVVDEVSMVDIFLMNSLMRAMPEGMRLILVGDADQLPSVGPGNVLNDIIGSGAVPVVRLTRIFRQAAQSLIVVNAHRINGGEPPIFKGSAGDFFFVKEEDYAHIGETVVELVTRRLPGYTGLDPLSIQVLAPMRKGAAGVGELNRLLQHALNPPEIGRRERMVQQVLLREGDRVMQVRNDYQLTWVDDSGREGTGVFNGDMGVLTDIDPEENQVQVRFDDGRTATYDPGQLESLELCYATTVHKSQGNEFEAVVIPLISGPFMLMTRNLLYTALTRAKRFAILVGRQKMILDMVHNDYISRRWSALDERLREMARVMGA